MKFSFFMLYLIGLGLNIDGISKEGMELVKRCKKIYFENYTVDFPYSFEELQHEIGKKLIPAGREFVESLEIIDEAKKQDVALLVYGSPLTATTHITLLHEARSSGIKAVAIHSSSIIDAVAETGLQIYKFGKITSMPKWQKNFNPESFVEIVQQNESIKAHTLILCDIGLEFQDALEQLEISAKNKNIKLGKIVACQKLGTRERKIFYGKILELKERNVSNPFCLIIPGELHFTEKEFLEGFRDVSRRS